jgi:hypothetical protein
MTLRVGSGSSPSDSDGSPTSAARVRERLIRSASRYAVVRSPLTTPLSWRRSDVRELRAASRAIAGSLSGQLERLIEAAPAAGLLSQWAPQDGWPSIP